MAPLNSHLAYKQDTSRLIYWIVKSSPSSDLPEDAPKTLNTNGQVTISDLLALSKLIATRISYVPSAILGLFDTVIQARTATYQAFQELVAYRPDPDIERSNASHKYFIDALVEAFEALGGPAWADKRNSKSADTNTDDQADLEQVLFANTFSALKLDGDAALGEEDEGESDDGSDIESQQNQAYRRYQHKRSRGKSKKQKYKKGAKKKAKQQRPTDEEPTLDDVPVESYRIIDDQEGIVTEYSMTVLSPIKEWAELRGYLQATWREVIYDGLNGAAAGALSNVAIKMVERSVAEIFICFPGHDSYETVMNTITRGDIELSQGLIRMRFEVDPDQNDGSKIGEAPIDIKEQLLIYAYNDLVDFIIDFQKNRSGKPTKRMLKELGNWDPEFDLCRASELERLKWRRCYTINWLYDLVNVFSSIVVQRNATQKEHHKLESVD
ncbi:uncharacterized protein F4822DRAFT_276754 [Hypoxylon trugodes]|uniref:uncharacterized protein n=1 Tax=Hypoxylon trugodes TaxID=326681 RepID=UPI00218E6C60|nr:uncharacterized protein F4822DRAFT_276754 [Hypoxylon trugodes]KAI1387222.1 hypothetical protein F4822DRAFT_276754 [Hypoxylon trugodes]